MPYIAQTTVRPPFFFVVLFCESRQRGFQKALRLRPLGSLEHRTEDSEAAGSKEPTSLLIRYILVS